MSEHETSRFRLDEGAFFWGAIVGFFVGALVWLWRVPQRGTETRQRLLNSGKELIERDSLEESLAEGRAIARLQQHEQSEAN